MEFALDQTSLRAIYAVYEQENIASQRIIEKLNFRYHETFREGSRVLNKYVHMVSRNT